jgi:hypothetical protein
MTAGEVFINNRALDGIDGLSFLDGVLYVNNVIADTIWRIPMDATGKAGNPVNIWTDQPLKAGRDACGKQSSVRGGKCQWSRVDAHHHGGQRACHSDSNWSETAHRHRAGGRSAVGGRPRQRQRHVDAAAALIVLTTRPNHYFSG